MHRRRDGVLAIRRAGRARRALLALSEGTLLLVPLVLVLAFVLPPPLLLVPPVSLAAALWALSALSAARRAPAPERRRVIPLRGARAGRGR